MQTDIAENSDSTLMYSHGASVPSFTSAESASTMCVCGEIGYAAITSGRHSATASATAREPSICLSTDGLLAVACHAVVGGLRRGDVPARDPAAEPLPDGDAAADVLEPELLDRPTGVQDDRAAVAQAAEHVDLVQQRRVLHDQCVGVRDRLVAADRAVVDPAERDDRRTGALRA